MQVYDVVVVGLGAMGSAAAAELAGRGAAVLGLERFGAGHDRGSSHGGSRIIRQAYFEDPSYVPLLLRAYEGWERLERDSGRDLMTLTGGLMIGPPGSRTLEGSRDSARRWGLAHELLGAADLRRRFPQLRPAEDDVALYEPAAGFVRPEEAVRAALQIADQRGAEMCFDTPVLDWEATGDGVRVRTADRTVEAGRLVVAGGAWAPDLLAGLGLPLVVERQVQYWFAPLGGVEPFLSHPIWIWEDRSGVQPYGFPAHEAGRGVKTAFFRMGQETTPDTIDRTVHPAEVERMRAALAAHVPALAGPLLDARTCMYTNTPDEHFVIAALPGSPQVAIAAGFSGHGFKFAPVVGEILADLALDGGTPQPIDLFDPARFSAASPGERAG
jgi:sarcosine oxidase